MLNEYDLNNVKSSGRIFKISFFCGFMFFIKPKLLFFESSFDKPIIIISSFFISNSKFIQSEISLKLMFSSSNLVELKSSETNIEILLDLVFTRSKKF